MGQLKNLDNSLYENPENSLSSHYYSSEKLLELEPRSGDSQLLCFELLICLVSRIEFGLIRSCYWFKCEIPSRIGYGIRLEAGESMSPDH